MFRLFATAALAGVVQLRHCATRRKFEEDKRFLSLTFGSSRIRMDTDLDGQSDPPAMQPGVNSQMIRRSRYVIVSLQRAPSVAHGAVRGGIRRATASASCSGPNGFRRELLPASSAPLTRTASELADM